MLGQGLGGARRVAGGFRAHAQPPQGLAALAKGDRHADHRGHVLDPGSRVGHQLEADRLEALADDLQPR
jgi:hypothetical protein